MPAPIPSPAEQDVVRHAVRRGMVSKEAVREALLMREQLWGQGRQATLLAILRARWLQPEHIPELTRVLQQTLTGGAVGADEAPTLREPDHAALPAAAVVPEDVLEMSQEAMRRTPTHDPETVQRFLRSTLEGTPEPDAWATAKHQARGSGRHRASDSHRSPAGSFGASPSPSGSHRSPSDSYRSPQATDTYRPGPRDTHRQATDSHRQHADTHMQSSGQLAAPNAAPHTDLFRRIGELGRGSEGVVYRVHDPRVRRQAAMKTLPPGASERSVERLQREVLITAALDHPGVPPIYEAGTDAKGQHYSLMRLIEGQSLAKKITALHRSAEPLQARPRELNELLEVMVKVAEVVGYAHSQGVVHRDLRPENVMVGRFGQVSVVNWGRAYDGSQNERCLADRFTEGSGYKAPEQANERGRDERVDVYALGAILFAILSGEPPSAPGADPGPAAPALAAVARKALEADVSQRTSTASAFVAELRRCLEAGRGGGSSALVVGLSLAGGLIAVLLLVLWQLERSKRAAAETSALEARQETTQVRARGAEELAAAEKEAAERVKKAGVESSARLQRAMDLLDRAELLVDEGGFRAGRKDLVLDALKKALAQDSQSRFVLWRGAELYRRVRESEEARKLARRVVKLHPPAYRELYFLHELEMRRGTTDPNTGRARIMTEPLQELIDLARKRGDRNEYTSLIDGLRAQQERRHGEAVSHYREALRHSPKMVMAHLNLGNVLRAQRQYKDALRAFSAAIHLQPHRAQTYVWRGSLRITLGDIPGAMMDLNTAIRLNPRDGEPYIHRGRVLMTLRDPKAALKDLNTAARLSPRNSSVFTYRGMLLIQIKRYPDAVKELSRALKLNPRNVVALAQRGRALVLGGRAKLALRDLETALRAQPRLGEAYYWRGLAKQKLGDKRGASKDYVTFMKLMPNDPKAKVLRRSVDKHRKRPGKGGSPP